MSFRPEDVDLAELTESLASDLAGVKPAGYSEGKTALRDLVLVRLDCSELEGEQVVDTLVAHGFVKYTGDPSAALDDGVWQIVGSD